MGFEPMVKVLQTFALPLGYVAMTEGIIAAVYAAWQGESEK